MPFNLQRRGWFYSQNITLGNKGPHLRAQLRYERSLLLTGARNRAVHLV